MKKFLIIFMTVILLVTITATFAGCGDKDISELKKQYDELKNNLDSVSGQYNDLNNKYNELDKRVKKLETTMSLLDIVGESAQFTELKNKVTQLQKDLLSNSTNDTQIKSQVTQMQLILDKIYSSDSTDKTILNEVQNQLNTLYGEVNRVLPFENGKEYEVKLNGVVYYTVSILIEYHDGKVQSSQDIIQSCPALNWKHYCGSIYVKNISCPSINCTDASRLNIMTNYFDNKKSYSSVIRNKENNNSSLINTLYAGEEGRFYFFIDPLRGGDSLPESNFKMLFRLPNNLDFNLLVLDNVWGDENGLKPPIIGTQS